MPYYDVDTCTFKMAKEHLRVSELFPMLNREKTRLGILDWGVKMTTIEDGMTLRYIPSYVRTYVCRYVHSASQQNMGGGIQFCMVSVVLA